MSEKLKFLLFYWGIFDHRHVKHQNVSRVLPWPGPDTDTDMGVSVSVSDKISGPVSVSDKTYLNPTLSHP